MDVYGIAASGLAAAQASLNLSANNIVNAETPNDDAEDVDLTESPTGGVSIDGIDPTGRPVDLATESITQRSALLMYDANAAVIRMADRMYGSLLNVLDTQNSNLNPDGTES